MTGAERARVLEAARGRYYSLTGLGLKSFTCRVRFDLGTLGPGLLPAEDVADRRLLEQARFQVTVSAKGAAVSYGFPAGATSQDPEVVTGVTGWITALVQGFFSVWPVKGLDGPLPRKDKGVKSLAQTSDGGYRLAFKGPAGPEEIRLDREFGILTISSRNGDLVERPVYLQNPAGLLFSGNQTTDREPEGVLQTRYSVVLAPVDGLLLPASVHLQVGQRVNVQFALDGCQVARH